MMLEKLRKNLAVFFASPQPGSKILSAYRCYDGQIETIRPITQAPTIELSPDILQKPGFVKIDGEVFDLRHDGVYRFYRLPHVAEQRMVCSGGALSAFKMLGYLWMYGGRDNCLSVMAARKVLTHHPVVSGCGNLSFLAKDILNSLGIRNRVVAAMSQKPWDGQDDGHTLLEIDVDDQWCLYDPSFSVIFMRGAHPTHLLGAFDSDIEIHHLPALPGHGEFTHKDYDYSFWVEERLLSDRGLKKWYETVFDVPLIYEENGFFFPKSRVDQQNMSRFLVRYSGFDDQDFMTKFYRENPDA